MLEDEFGEDIEEMEKRGVKGMKWGQRKGKKSNTLKTTTITVSAGESIKSIAADLGISEEAIRRVNEMSDEDRKSVV